MWTQFISTIMHDPDLVILDVKLLDGTAFDILDKFNEIKFAIIFITAYENFAVKAFKFSAIAFLAWCID